MTKTWTPEMVNTLKVFYPIEGPSGVMKRLNLGYNAVTMKARKLKIRDPNRCKKAADTRSTRSTNVNQYYFDAWSENMAYVLGYIWADGCIRTTPKKVLRFACVTDDEQLLFDIQRDMQSKHKPYRRPGKIRNGYQCRPTTEVSIGCVRLIDVLTFLYGLVPNKSFYDLPYPEIPDSWFGHFFRGNLDGDGTAFTKSDAHGSDRIAFCGRLKFVTGMRDQLCRILGLRLNTVSVTSGGLASVGWSYKEDVKKLIDFLYPPGDYIFLSRKHTKINIIQEQLNG